jgi:long-chain fatty acid transport protein
VSASRTIRGQGSAAGGLTLRLPDYLELSGFQQVTDNLALHYSYKFTHWSRFKELHATFNDGELAFHKDEKYRSNSRYALGDFTCNLARIAFCFAGFLNETIKR